MKKIHYFLLVILLLTAPGCDNREKLYYSSPSVIPNTHRQMKSAGFWIARQGLADKVILDPADIESFNLKTEEELKFKADPSGIGQTYSGEELKSSLEKALQRVGSQRLYFKDARIAGKSFYGKMKELMDIESIPPRIDVRYGFVCRYADERVLPTGEILTEHPGDIDFDELQNSSLDIGVPLAVLHTTKDGVWAYVRSPTNSGWIKKENIAFCEAGELKDFSRRTPFIVVTGAKADVFLDEELTQYIDYVRMGARFPCTDGAVSETVRIVIPFREEGGRFVERAAYIKRSEVSFGYLPYTPRNIILQAFKLLNAPYGWGGFNGEQDCSSFLQEIFSTTGIILPRNSSEQAKVGRSLGSFSGKNNSKIKMRILKDRAVAGITILQMEGHVLLYLGMIEGNPYAIHETNGYRQRMWWGQDIVRQIKKVTVSDLSLGEGSRKGSLLERIMAIRSIDPDPVKE